MKIESVQQVVWFVKWATKEQGITSKVGLKNASDVEDIAKPIKELLNIFVEEKIALLLPSANQSSMCE